MTYQYTKSQVTEPVLTLQKHYMYVLYFISPDIYIVADDSDEQLALKLHR